MGSWGRNILLVALGLVLGPMSVVTAAEAPSKGLGADKGRGDDSCSRLLLQFRKPPPLGIESDRNIFGDLSSLGVRHINQGLGALPNAWVLTVDERVLSSRAGFGALSARLRRIGESRGMGGVAFVERDAVWVPREIPSDPLFAQQKPSLDAVHAVEAWTRIKKIPHRAAVVAVVDTGIRYSHVDLQDEMWQGNAAHGENFFTGAPDDTNDHTGHGTAVAGALAATSDNGEVVASIPWKNGIQLVIARAAGGEDGDSCTDDIINAIDYAAKEANASIINLSMGGSSYSQALRTELVHLGGTRPGMLLVAAVPNRTFDLDSSAPGHHDYPTSYHLDNVISVEAVTNEGFLRSSAFGQSSVQLAAPGLDIYTTDYSSDSACTQMSGTSLAAPQVSATAALVSAYSPGWSSEQVRQYLIDSAHNRACDMPDAPPEIKPLCGKSESGGILNVDKATGAPVEFTEPLQGASWQAGASYEVQWKPLFQTKLCPTVDLYLSLDDGVDWSAPSSFPQGLQTLGGASTVTVTIPPDLPGSTTARLALRCHDTARLERWCDTFTID